MSYKITLIQQCTLIWANRYQSTCWESTRNLNPSECPTLRYISAKQNEEPHVWSYATGEHGRQYTANYNRFLSATECQITSEHPKYIQKEVVSLKNVRGKIDAKFLALHFFSAATWPWEKSQFLGSTSRILSPNGNWSCSDREWRFTDSWWTCLYFLYKYDSYHLIATWNMHVRYFYA